MKSLKAIWQFCSYLFVPQWGKNKERHWGDYARGAKYALRKRFELSHCIEGVIQGSLPVGGLSSSDVWPIRARSMKTGSCVPMVASVTPAGMPSVLTLQVMVIPTRNWRYSPRL